MIRVLSFKNQGNHKPIAGHVLLATTEVLLKHDVAPVSLLDWRAHSIKRKVNSTLSAETEAVKAGLGRALHARKLFVSMLDPTWSPKVEDEDPRTCGIKVAEVTDCASLYDNITSNVRPPTEERDRIPVLIIKEDLKKKDVEIRWSPTKA